MENAVVYARYSSHGQTEQSIEGQLRDCYAFAEREGYQIVHEYIDRAITGRSDDRPSFQRMVKDAQKKQFCAIIVWKLDRFARNRYDSAHYKAQLKKSNVRVISATETISDSPEGIIMEGMLESLAEYYSANLSKHVKRGMRETILKGHYPGGVPPLGYRVENQMLVPNEDERPIIEYLFERYSAGESKKEIVTALNNMGYRNRQGKKFTLASFYHTLRNKTYIGQYEYNGERVDCVSENLVADEVFTRVQNNLDMFKRAPAAKKAKVDYLLFGKLFCGPCGANMIGESGRSKNGNTYNYYTCANRKKYHSCKKNNERKDFIEWYVVEQTVNYVLDETRIEYIAQRLVEEYEKEFGNSRIRDIEQKIESLGRDITRAVDATLETNSATARAQFYKKIDECEAQKADLEIDLAHLRIANGIRYTKDQIIAWLRTFTKGDPLDVEFQKRIIDVFVNAIYLYDDKIVLYYNVKDSKQVSYMEMLDSTEEPAEDTGPPSACSDFVRDGLPIHSIRALCARMLSLLTKSQKPKEKHHLDVEINIKVVFWNVEKKAR